MGRDVKRSWGKGAGGGYTRYTHVSRNPGCRVTLTAALLELSLKATESPMAAVKPVL